MTTAFVFRCSLGARGKTEGDKEFDWSGKGIEMY